MFDHLIESNNLGPSLEQYGLSGTDIVLIKELIVGPEREAAHQTDWPYKGRGIDKSFLYEVKIIVYNYKNLLYFLSYFLGECGFFFR